MTPLRQGYEGQAISNLQMTNPQTLRFGGQIKFKTQIINKKNENRNLGFREYKSIRINSNNQLSID
jgi:hypothetical protein